MHWKYVPILSITAHHEKYPPRSAADPLPNVAAFVMEPSQATRERFQRLGWLWKRQEGGIQVFAQKTIADGVDIAGGRPLEKEGFTFYIRSSNTALLSETSPFNTALSSAWGQPRLLCFDSLSATPQADGTLALANPVEASHVGSRLPVPVQFEPAAADITEMTITPVSPGATSKNISLNSKSRRFDINESEGNYLFTQEDTLQTIHLTPNSLPANTIGIARIFSGPGNAWEPARHFRLFFAL